MKQLLIRKILLIIVCIAVVNLFLGKIVLLAQDDQQAITEMAELEKIKLRIDTLLQRIAFSLEKVQASEEAGPQIEEYNFKTTYSLHRSPTVDIGSVTSYFALQPKVKTIDDLNKTYSLRELKNKELLDLEYRFFMPASPYICWSRDNSYFE